MSEHIRRIPRSDSEGDYIILNVTSNGPSPLDLKLVATEGNAPYITTIKQSRISKLRAQKADLDESDWAVILSSTLLQQRITGNVLQATKDVEIVSSIAGQQLIVTFRKNISGIIHRLGTLTLAQDEEQEVSLFAWAGSALESSASLEKEVLHLSHKYDEQGNMVKKLNAQLEDLIKAKQEHENALLEKFRELLNAKKLKIRDQQRLLAEAKVDPNKADQVKASRSTGPSRTPKPSRTSKRKAATTAPPPASSDAEDTGFEAMTVDNNDQGSDLAAEDQPGTPDKSDLDATEDEDDDLDPAPVPQPPKSGVGAKGKIIEGAENNAVEAEEPASPPPRRELPFKPLEAPQPRPRADSSGKASQKDADDGGDMTSDDEL
ncbi:MAG: hypothetical protein FRX48_06140 [Lasallia pustulata]|uniref:DNA double-strand break repair and VJ recombination XRCC4 n=1 Tax=Lasallia pustulata TaxID=136370 RepID=A0A5M8PJB4_9LECA|nr:MAG: hypothetical protein FRX48_06140 [Lasallia pustulata]